MFYKLFTTDREGGVVESCDVCGSCSEGDERVQCVDTAGVGEVYLDEGEWR